MIFRYGDFTPTTHASRVLMLFWMLTGLILMNLISGAISSAMTVNDVSNDLILYGKDVSKYHFSKFVCKCALSRYLFN